MRPYVPRHQQRIADIDGIPAETYLQEKQIQQHHFGSLLEGEITTLAQHLTKQRSQYPSLADKHSTVVGPTHAIPQIGVLTKKTH